MSNTPIQALTLLFAQRARRWLLATLALALCALPAAGQTSTWVGGGGDGIWSDVLNWQGDVVPAGGNALVFTGSAKLNNTNNISNLRVGGITFNATGFNLYQSGANSSITNTNGILDNAGGNSINIIQSLSSAETFTNNSGGTTTFGSAITNNGWNLTVTGGGAVTFNGILGGTNTASTNYMTGALIYSGSATLRLAAANTFSGGVTNNAGGTVQLGNATGIPSGATKGDIHLANGSTLDIDANSPTLNGLYDDGTCTINNSGGSSTYTITVGNNSSNSAGIFGGTIEQTSGVLALAKINTNSFTFNGIGTYTGPTTVSAGTFFIGTNGTLTSTNIIVTAGALLDVSALGTNGLPLSSGGLVAGRATNSAAGIYDINGTVVNNSGPMVIYAAGKQGTMTINGGLTVNGLMQYDLGNTTTVGGGVNDLVVINGPLTLGSGTFVLTPSAGTFVSGGTYTLISNMTHAAVSGSVSTLTAITPRGATATFGLDANNNLTVTIAGTGAAGNLVWAGTAALANWDVDTTEDWVDSGTTTPDFFFNLDNVTFNDPGYPAVNIATGVSPGSTTVNNTSNSYTFSGTGLISGNGTFTKNGTNITTFETPNTYLGDTFVNGGALDLGIEVGAPEAATFLNEVIYANVPPGNLWLNGGGVFMSGQADTTFQADFNTVYVGPGDNAINSRGRQSSSQSQIQIQQIVRNGVGGTIDINFGQKTGSPQVGVMITNTAVVNGILGGWAIYANTDWLVPEDTGEGAINLGNEADGAGTAANYQTSATPSAWGATSNIYLSSAATAPLAAGTTINSLKILGASVTINPGVTLTLISGGVLMPSTTGGASSIVGGTLEGATNADLIVNQWNVASALTIGAVIADNTNTSATGGSALTKSGQGTLILTNANTYSGPTFINGFSLFSQPSGDTPAWDNPGALELGAGGSISNSAYITNAGTLIFDRADTSGYPGLIAGPGVVKQIGAGTTVLGGDNTYTGATTITAGTVQIGAGGGTGSISNSIAVTDTGTLVFDVASTRTYGGTISGAGSVINAGAGVTVLNGTNTYTGSTVISAGTLALGANGSISNSSLVSNVFGTTFDVSAVPGGFTLSSFGVGQTLAISGAVNGSVVVSGSSTAISPGGVGVIGTAAFNNNLTLSGGTLEFDVNGSSWDAITVAGTLNLVSGNIGLNNLGGPLANGTYPLVTAANITGSAASLNPPVVLQGGQIDYLTNSGTVLSLVVASGTGASLTWTGDGVNNIWNVDSGIDWLNATTPSVYQQFDYVTFNTVGDANNTVDIAASVYPAAVTVDDPNQPYTFQGTGKITLGASLTLENAQTLNILTTNDYQGFTTITNGGTITVGNGSASGSIGKGAVTNNAALVYNIPDTETIAGGIWGDGSLTLSGSGEVNLTGNNANYSGPIAINSGVLQVGASLAGGGTTGTLGTGPIVDNTVLAFNRTGAAFTYPGSISGAGVVSNVGLGTVILSGDNTYAGNTIIAAGSIKVGSPTAIPSGTGSGNVELDGSATAGASTGVLDLNGFDTAINGLLGAVGVNPGTVANNSGTATHTLIIGTGGNSVTYSGQIVDNTGSGGKVALLIENGVTQTIDVETPVGNTFSGGTIISNATVTLTSPSAQPYPNAASTALGTGPITFYGSNSVLNVVGSPAQSTTPTWSPGLGNTVIVPAGQAGTVSGPSRGTFNPILQGSGDFSYIANYVRGGIAGNWSAFTGQIYWIGSTGGGGDNLGIGTTNGFYKVFCTNAAVVYNTVAGTPTIAFGELSDDGSTTIEAATSGNAGGVAANFAVGSANTSTNFGGSIIDANGIIKVGTGTWTLYSPTITYSGITTVSNGTLVFSNTVTPNSTLWTISAPGILDVTGPGVLTVGASADETITGNGTIRGNLTTGADGVVDPGGAAIGTLMATGTAALGGNISMRLNTTNGVLTNDALMAGSIVLGGNLSVNNTGPTLLTGDSFHLFNSTNITGGFANVVLPVNNGAGVTYTWDTNLLATSGIISLTSGGSPVDTNAINFSFSAVDGVLTLTWPLNYIGWELQSQTNPPTEGITTNWVTVAGTELTNTASFDISTSNSVFYRLIYTNAP